MKNIKTIFIDLDGVLFKSLNCIVDMYNNDFKNAPNYSYVSYDKVQSWTFKELIATTPEHINEYFNQERFFNNVKLFDDSKEIIDELNKKYDIVFVSHGNPPNLKLKEKYIEKYFPYAKFIGVDLNLHKDKSCVDMSDGIFIDDVYKNLVTSNALIKICFGNVYKWNVQYLTNNKNAFRAYSWKEVKNIIDNY